MTKTDFIILCESNAIAPEIALENPSIVEALANRDDEKVAELLQSEF